MNADKVSTINSALWYLTNVLLSTLPHRTTSCGIPLVATVCGWTKARFRWTLATLRTLSNTGFSAEQTAEEEGGKKTLWHLVPVSLLRGARSIIKQRGFLLWSFWVFGWLPIKDEGEGVRTIGSAWVGLNFNFFYLKWNRDIWRWFWGGWPNTKWTLCSWLVASLWGSDLN